MSDLAFYFVADERYLPPTLMQANRIRRLWNADVHVFVESGGPGGGVTPLGDGLFRHDNRLMRLLPERLPATDNWPRIVYCRLFAPALLRGYRRLVYLDADICVMDRDESLLSVPLPGGLGAVQDSATIDKGPAKTGLTRNAWLASIGLRGHRYFNSGALLIDPAIWDGFDVAGALSRFSDAHGASVMMPDQDFLNWFFQDSWTELSPRFNFQQALFNFGLETVFPPVFLHFSSRDKPWLGKADPHTPHGQIHPLYRIEIARLGYDPDRLARRNRNSLPVELRRRARAGLSRLGLATGKERRLRADWTYRRRIVTDALLDDIACGRYADPHVGDAAPLRAAVNFDGRHLRRPLHLNMAAIDP